MRAVLCACVVSLVAIVVLASVACAQVAGPSTSVVSGAENGAAARRDPFVRPAAAAVDASTLPPRLPVPPFEGLPGLSAGDVTVRGVLRADGHSLALIQSPDRTQFVVRAGDRLRDATIEAVIADGLVMLFDNSAALAGGRIRKTLRGDPEDK
jgi:hypothetical protein